jgi:hypothetical protein
MIVGLIWINPRLRAHHQDEDRVMSNNMRAPAGDGDHPLMVPPNKWWANREPPMRSGN